MWNVFVYRYLCLEYLFVRTEIQHLYASTAEGCKQHRHNTHTSNVEQCCKWKYGIACSAHVRVQTSMFSDATRTTIGFHMALCFRFHFKKEF
jgi:hypothetical protein